VDINSILSCVAIFLFLIFAVYQWEKWSRRWVHVKMFEDGPDARAWFTTHKNPHAMIGYNLSQEEALLFLNQLYTAGALKVQISSVMVLNPESMDKKEPPRATGILVVLPENETKKDEIKELCKDRKTETVGHKMLIDLN